MPTGLLNVVCDECHGGRMAYLGTGEIQLEHQPGCPHKWREDTFLIDLAEQLHDKNPDGPIGMTTYPEGAKLNPIIYDYLHRGYFTEWGNKTFAKVGQSKAQLRAQKVNRHFQLVRQAAIENGTWNSIIEEMTAIRLAL